jgi:hypothetical protein
MWGLGGTALVRLRALLGRATTLSTSGSEAVESGVFTGEERTRAVVLLGRAVSALEDLAGSMMALEALGL